VLTVHPTLLIGPSDWQPERMPEAEFAARIGALWRAQPQAAHALVYGDPRHHAELAYLTNFVPKLEAAVALIARSGEHRLFVGGGANMLDAARPLTFLADLVPLRELDHARLADCALIGSGYMPGHLRKVIAGAASDAAADATAEIWALMRRKSPAELAAVRAACETLGAATMAMAQAARTGLAVTDVVLAGEKIAIAQGAQDVRTLFSVNGGRTLVPFSRPVRDAVDPLQVYMAVRRFNYWAEGFAHLSRMPTPVAIKVAALLHNALAAIKARTTADTVAAAIAAEPYRRHPVTDGAFANIIGLALEEPPCTDLGASFEAGEVYSLKAGVTDGEDQHAIVSAMVTVHENGAEVLWPPHLQAS
jgi:hypothetical protein